MIQYKKFTIKTPDANITVAVARENKEIRCGYIIWSEFGSLVFHMRDSWDEMTPEGILEDVDLGTRKGDYISFANMHHEINKLKVRDQFGLKSDWTDEERKNIFRLWYSSEARSLTHGFQFPLLRGQKSVKYPYGSRQVEGFKFKYEPITKEEFLASIN